MTSTSTHTLPVAALRQAVCDRVRRVVASEPEVIETLLIAMVAGGHTLIEGIPGIGKTLLARTLARCVGCDFRRIQFTNDLMPSDIVGTAVWRPSRESFTFAKGPLFTNIVLADEINRTSPRTLSCLLEAMENGTASVEGRTMQLGEPFLVWATRNGIEFHGTYPIPEAALDRFLVCVELSYPTRELELALYRGTNPEDELGRVEPVMDREQLLELMRAVAGIAVSEPVADYCYRIVHATRSNESIALGASPRAAMCWLRAAKARALLHDRSAVLPDDLIHTARAVLAHRVFVKGSGSSASWIEQILADTPIEL